MKVKTVARNKRTGARAQKKKEGQAASLSGGGA